ncbi:hypothetical protein ACPWR0_10075 [Pandoraea pneumonica]|uniref:hypothetical protein n=1 Tax=Pandoraea pneumonica TaxID=2508299 RepID=UPI003CF31310
MFPISHRIAHAACHGARQLGHESAKFDKLDYVARREAGAPIECRDEQQLGCLMEVVGTPHAALTLNAILDTGMQAEGAADLHTRLRGCRDSEIFRRIMATPTLHDWAFDATWQIPSESHNQSLMLSLRVLQLFGHTTSVPVIFDPEHRRVVFHYVPGNTPAAPTEGDERGAALRPDHRLRMLLNDAADGRNPGDALHRASRNALMLLTSANDIDGCRQRWPRWQRRWDQWRHGNDDVRTLSTRLTPEFESWLEVRAESAVSHSQDYLYRKGLADLTQRRD